MLDLQPTSDYNNRIAAYKHNIPWEAIVGRWTGKYVIGITGNIATGKSIIRKMLEHLGAFGIDADSLAQRAMAPGAPAYQPVINTFGHWILDNNKRINRASLARVVFTDPTALAKLEAIVHPIVAQAIDTLIRRSKQKVVAVEAIKLIESGLADACDAVWVVNAPPQAQLGRLVHKRKLSELEARQRMAAQPPQADKLQRADVVIDNGGKFEASWAQVQREWAKIARAQETPPAAEQVTTHKVTPQAHAGAQGGLQATLVAPSHSQARLCGDLA